MNELTAVLEPLTDILAITLAKRSKFLMKFHLEAQQEN